MLAVDTCMKLYRVGAASCKMPKMLWSIRKDIEWSSMFFWLLFHHHFGAAEDSRSQSNQRMAQTALTQMLSAVAPKFARCKMRLTKFTEHSIFFLNLSEAIAAILHQVITQRMELSSADMPLWPGFAKSHCFQNVFDLVWSSLIKSDQVLGVLFFFLCGGPAELMKLGMLALGSDSLFEKRRHFITCPITLFQNRMYNLFPQQQNALGSSAIVKVSEQLQNWFPQSSQVPSTGSQYRFPSKGSQVPK